MGLDQLRELSVLLTTDCNLRCAYCYQDAKRPGAMAWPSLRTAIDRLLDLPAERPVLSFAGGEAALEWTSIRRAVDYARAKSRAGQVVGFHLVTNGLLLRAPRLQFLASNDFALDLSFDGVPAAQQLRSAASFARLDRLLDELRSRHAGYFARRVSVSVTVARASIPHLSSSFEYFLGMGLRSITCRPAMGQEEWDGSDLARLDVELSAIVAASIAHHAETGLVPLTNFRARGSGRRAPQMEWGCSAPLTRALVVDVDGQAYPCAVFARSYQAFTPGIDQRVQALSLGDIRDPSFPERLACFADACRRSGVFDPKRLQHSGDRRCASCRERTQCIVCPLARLKRPDVSSPDLDDIPRYLCAYERILGKHRRRFIARVPAPRGEQLLQRLLAERREARRTRC